MKKALSEKSKILIAIALIFISVAGLLIVNRKEPVIEKLPFEGMQVTDNSIISLVHAPTDSILTLETASTPGKRESGLMFRTDIKKDEGMIFIFPAQIDLSFWMKNTPTSLDMIFLNSELKVTSIFSNTKPEQTTEIYDSKSPSQYVIETLAGWANEHHVKEDDLFQITSVK